MVFEKLKQEGHEPSFDTMAQDVMALRLTIRNMLRRRKQVLALESQESSGGSRRVCSSLPDDYVLSAERVEHYMRQHRREFENSHGQKLLVAVDMEEGGLSRWHAVKRMDNRLHGITTIITTHMFKVTTYPLL